MARRIENAVAKNRDERLRLNAQFIETGVNSGNRTGPGSGTPGGGSGTGGGPGFAGGGGPELVVTANELRVAVADVGLYTRDLSEGGPQLTVGHPDPEHGIGRGVVGDNRSEWSLVDTTTESAVLTTDGKRRLAGALVGDVGTVTAIGVGAGTTPADGDDVALGAGTELGFAFGVIADIEDAGGIDESTATARSLFRFHEFGDVVSEVGTVTDDGLLVARATTSEVDPTPDQELRVDITFRMGADAVGDTEFTDAGEEAFANALVRSDAVALQTVAIGSDDSPITDGDTTLAEEIDRDPTETVATVRPRGVGIRSRWSAGEPEEQPVTIREIGVLDGSGDLVWRAVIDPYEKTRMSPYTAGMTVAIREG